MDLGREGRLVEALALSDTLTRMGPVTRVGDPFARGILYLSRARWQVAAGRKTEAVATLGWTEQTDLDGWAQGEAQAYDVDLALSPYTRLRLATLLREEGQLVRACRLAQRVGELWEGAEPGLGQLRSDVDRILKDCRR
jgi:hypothetical protein